jgi:hypothetical protein
VLHTGSLFCFSQFPFRLLCKCIQCVHQGQVWANSEQMQYVVDVLSQVPSLHMVNSQGIRLLTPRQEQVVALVADGLGNRDIARELCGASTQLRSICFTSSTAGHFEPRGTGVVCAQSRGLSPSRGRRQRLRLRKVVVYVDQYFSEWVSRLQPLTSGPLLLLWHLLAHDDSVSGL